MPTEHRWNKLSPSAVSPPSNRKMRKKWTRQPRAAHADVTQAEQAFARHSRSMKAPSQEEKNLAPNGSNGVGSAGVADANVGIGEQERMLLERRKRWVETIGPVFDHGLLTDLPPSGSVFNDLDELTQREEAGAAVVGGGGGIGIGGVGGGGVLEHEE